MKNKSTRIFGTILALVILCGSMTGCSSASENGEGRQDSGSAADVSDPVSGGQSEAAVVMTTEFSEYSVNTEKINYTITNNGSETFFFGDDFSFQRYENGQWVDVPTTGNGSITGIAGVLHPKKNRDDSFDMGERFKLPLPEGTYRLGKGESKKVYAQFTLK